MIETALIAVGVLLLAVVLGAVWVTKAGRVLMSGFVNVLSFIRALLP